MENKKATHSLGFSFDDDAESFTNILTFVKTKGLKYNSVENDELYINVFGTQSELIEVAELDHKLHGDGFSFNLHDATECMEEIE